MSGSVDLTVSQLKTVRSLLERYLPGLAVWAYGSRVKWTSRPESDLDLVVFADTSYNARVSALREAFEESNLPFRVDLFVWDEVPEKFRKIIEAEHIVIQEKEQRRGAMGSKWQEKTWGDLATLEYGKALRGYRDANEGFRVYGTNGPIGWHEEPLCPHPGVIVGRKGAYRGIHFSSEPFFVIDTAFYLNQIVDFDIKWAYYELLTHDINGMDSGSAIPSTSRESFYRLPVRVPPKDEQCAIAHILGSLDDKIELNRQMNQTLEAMAQAIFKSWFVDFDPVRAKAAGRDPGLPKEIADLFPDSFEDSELGEIPKGWKVKSLDEVANFLNGLACQKYPPKEGEESLPVIKIRELRQGISENTDRASVNVLEQYIIEDGDVLFSWSGSLLVNIWCGGRGVLNQHVFKVTSEKYPKWFFLHWTAFHLVEFQRIAADKATTMGHIKRRHLTEAKVLVPSEDLLYAMTDIMSPLIEQRLQNNLESKKLSLLRDTLLPKLISGELRVPNAEKLLEGLSD